MTSGGSARSLATLIQAARTQMAADRLRGVESDPVILRLSELRGDEKVVSYASGSENMSPAPNEDEVEEPYGAEDESANPLASTARKLRQHAVDVGYPIHPITELWADRPDLVDLSTPLHDGLNGVFLIMPISSELSEVELPSDVADIYTDISSRFEHADWTKRGEADHVERE